MKCVTHHQGGFTAAFSSALQRLVTLLPRLHFLQKVVYLLAGWRGNILSLQDPKVCFHQGPS